MSYDVLKLCKDKGDYFEVDPAVMFPATIKRIQEVLAGEMPTEIVSAGWTGHPLREPTTDKFLRQAEAFPADDWKLGLSPYREPIDPGKDANEKAIAAFEAEKARNAQRAQVMDFAESWFKRSLVLKVGRGIRIHISKNLDYKR